MSLQIGLISVCNNICKWRLTMNHTCSSNRINEVSITFKKYVFLNKESHVLQYHFRNFHSKRKYTKELIVPIQKAVQCTLLMMDQNSLVECSHFAQTRIPGFNVTAEKRWQNIHFSLPQKWQRAEYPRCVPPRNALVHYNMWSDHNLIE